MPITEGTRDRIVACHQHDGWVSMNKKSHCFPARSRGCDDVYTASTPSREDFHMQGAESALGIDSKKIRAM